MSDRRVYRNSAPSEGNSSATAAVAAATSAEQAPERASDEASFPSTSTPPSSSAAPTISARRPLGSRPGLTLTPPPPVATLLRALASAGAILVDDDLRSRAAHALRAGVRTAPQRAREVVHRAQQNAAAARLARGLAAEREAKVDVQVGPELFEDDEQELRSRMWVAVLEDDSLFGSVVARRPSSAGEGTEEEGGEGGGGGAEGARSGAQGEEGSPDASDLDGKEDEEVEEEEGKEREEREEGAEREFLRRMEEEHVAAAAPPSSRPVAPAPAPALPVEDKSSSTDPWEMVQGSSNLYPASSASRLRKESGRDASAKATHEGAKKPKKPKKTKSLSERVLDAVDACNWPLSTEYAETGEYNRLVSAPFPPGDDTDDAVGRDIGRTFPEHPQFGYAHGRAALARVLRAAALADPAVGYCQGMAFVAGVLLMFLPEELSFRVLTKRLLREQEVIKDEEEEEKDAEGLEKEVDGGEEEKEREREPRPPRVGGGGGAGLRTLYEPGLSGLKSLLAQYDWLLARLAPEVSARLSALGIPPVLYAAQWVLTAFACPFPPAVAARVLDAVLLERSPAPLLRASLAVAVALGPELLEAPADFEAALKVLKLRPPAWTRAEARAALSRGLCGDLVPAGAVEAAAAAVGARAEREARLEEEGRSRERAAERARRGQGEARGRGAAAATAAAPAAAPAAAAPPLSYSPAAAALQGSSLASLELAFEGLAWSGAAAAEAEESEATGGVAEASEGGEARLGGDGGGGEL